ncbi:MAG: copper resistance protein B [Caulobacteraceae bacterium]
MRALPSFAAALAAAAVAGAASAQVAAGDPNIAAPYGPPVADEHVWVHGVLDQFEARLRDGDTGLRWDGEAWAGPDEWRLWLKSEGEVTHGQVSDGQTEVYVSKPISTYFDVQVGGRYDLDSGPGRGWGAIGVEGLAPYFFHVAATAYVSDQGRYAAKFKTSYDQLLTNRLILEPEAEINLYARDDPARRVGSGLSDLDAGLRLRYEIARKFAPYVGVTWEQKFGRTASFARAADEPSHDVRLAVGIRSWF